MKEVVGGVLERGGVNAESGDDAETMYDCRTHTRCPNTGVGVGKESHSIQLKNA